jgi:hypothetical protein
MRHMGNSIAPASLLTSSYALQNAGNEASIAMLKKTNDIAKQEGDAIVQLLENSTAQINEGRLDVYA